MASLVVFGDSLAAEFGTKGRGFPSLLAERTNREVLNLAGSAQLVDESADGAARAAGCDTVIIMHGISEAIVRPTDAVLSYLPRRWRQPGWMDPRAYYSRKATKRLGQRLESEVRWRVKVALLARSGSALMSSDAYERELARLVEVVAARRTVIIGGAQIDDRFFPGSQASLDAYSARSRRVAEMVGATYCDIKFVCEKWEDYLLDHFHPNARGQEKIADRIHSLI